MSVLVSLCAVLLAACASNDSASSGNSASAAKANKQVDLRIHAWTGYTEDLKDDFIAHMRQQGYQARISIEAASGFESFSQAITSNKADLISPAHDLAPIFIQQNLVQKLDHNLLPSLKQINPAIINRLTTSDDLLPYVAPLTFGPYALAYRKDAFETPPQSYRELWNPKHQGKISIAEYDTANIYMTPHVGCFPIIYST